MSQREIKFRAMMDGMGDCTWVYGSLIRDAEGRPRIQENMGAFLFTTCLKGTEGQFTGVKDSCGNDIYEGDILDHDDAVDLCCVVYIECEFYAEDFDKLGYDLCATCTVIGNIHENPELFKP